MPITSRPATPQAEPAASPSRSPRPPRPTIWVVLACALLLALPAVADWLVTRDGGRVETRGPWEVKGRLVVFTTADGQLSSMRTADVDLEASRQATEEARRTAEETSAEEEPRDEPTPVRRKITDADIPPGTSNRPAPAMEEGEEGEEGETGEEGPEGPPASNLVVVFSEGEAADDGHTRVRGTLANRGNGPAVGVRLTVHLYDFEGETLASAQARLQSTALQAGQTADFVADFPEVFSYAAMSFEPAGTSLAHTPGSPSGDPGSPSGDGDEAPEDGADDASSGG